jgi:hypothetical protein
VSRRGRLAKHAGPGQEESQRTLKIKDVHDDCSAAKPRNAAQGRSASAGFCASGLDRHSTAVIGPGGGWSAGSAVLSRPLVTLLSPPVGGISQALQSYSCRRCQLGGCFRVDAPEKSEAVRQQLRLPFPILSDRERRVVQEWDIYNPKEKGGIARPAVFILAPDRTVGSVLNLRCWLSSKLRRPRETSALSPSQPVAALA